MGILVVTLFEEI